MRAVAALSDVRVAREVKEVRDVWETWDVWYVREVKLAQWSEEERNFIILCYHGLLLSLSRFWGTFRTLGNCFGGPIHWLLNGYLCFDDVCLNYELFSMMNVFLDPKDLKIQLCQSVSQSVTVIVKM